MNGQMVQYDADGVYIPDWLSTLLWITAVVVAIWLVSFIFILLRRNATNLTPTQNASVKKSAEPDFLKVDHKKREEAIKRGEEFAEKLTEREKAEAAAAEAALHPDKKKTTVGMLENLAKLASIAFSLFSLAGVILGAITQVDKLNTTLSSMDKIWLVIAKYPVPVAIAVFVIGYHIYLYFSKRKWEDAKA
ncbi:MAG TPA: hypothetical protein VG942_07090 [Hyphomonadaceae bacterium]|nr:hypothetical protein [Hyphomonadaceae bacterium]